MTIADMLLSRAFFSRRFRRASVASMPPPPSTRPLASTTANARTTTSSFGRKTTASPALSATSEKIAGGTPATTPARARASLAPSFGSTRPAASSSTTGVRKPSPPNAAASSTVKPGHTRATASISSTTTAPRVGLAGGRAAPGGLLSRSVGGPGAAAAAARKPEGTGKKELEDKVRTSSNSVDLLPLVNLTRLRRVRLLRSPPSKLPSPLFKPPSPTSRPPTLPLSPPRISNSLLSEIKSQQPRPISTRSSPTTPRLLLRLPRS